MYIGEVSQRTGLSAKAIRLYEEMGLIRTLPRVNRYRTYSETDIEVLQLIAEAKQLGVTLNRLKGVIRYQHGVVDWARIHQFLKDVRGELMAERQRLNAQIQQVEHCLATIHTCPQGLDSAL
ncbi:MerR family transcriptional regulator [Photobacterium sp. 1_MG-2023]|uniref:MerR family transcriptional regulator n=1 Tax=Photobacterium sp. 1_MG-2023 TaxID=3062646 RepID=UPI0026E1A9B2|nr:MerR family transcriptional regulator [Photobacterium sp. 1_MG-2023]MDO6708585.1 MerR family transcriptional regulator [Photobacterium sp. 1_MG-2023]